MIQGLFAVAGMNVDSSYGVFKNHERVTPSQRVFTRVKDAVIRGQSRDPNTVDAQIFQSLAKLRARSRISFKIGVSGL